MKTIWKKVLKIGLFCCAFALVFAIGYLGLNYVFAPVKFDSRKITNSNLSINIFDSQSRPLEHTYTYGDYVKLNQIPKQTIDCFISIEDKQFYSHNGLNYKRMVGAMAKNIASFSFKEGASTISQQLIKNTHLSSEKSIKRKINEIKLTKELENKFSKDEILENYLNVIYFGDNCYGIQNASWHYFSKPASKLTLGESAILAGMIKSPNKYHPVNQYENCIKRRNVVLKEMLEDNKIDQKTYTETISDCTKVEPSGTYNHMNSFAKATIKEAQGILKMPEKQIAIGGYRIFTYMDKQKQQALENCVETDLSVDCSLISINAKNGYVEAYYEKSSLPIITMQRQPASAIKPILVYAPAINENIISPSTVILDESVSINGYKPQNIGGKEHGYVSAKEAISNSYNIPAVKILSYVGIDKAKGYLERQNIKFDNSDNNLALALGGMTYGITLKDLTNCYQTFANNGEYINSKFINYILDGKGHVVYKNASAKRNVYRNDTCFLITDMLHTCAKTGTAKKLSNLDFYVASKTGTSSISKKNLDAYNISYTTEDVVGCWVGNIDNSPMDIVGGGTPTDFVKKYLVDIYSSHKPEKFTMPSSVVCADIDTLARDNEHIIYKANNFLPERYREQAYFSRFNEPKVNMSESITLSPVTVTGKVLNGVAIISFDAKIYNYYEIYQVVDDKVTLVEQIDNKNGQVTCNISQSPNKVCKYYVVTKAKNQNNNMIIESEKSNIINLYYSK